MAWIPACDACPLWDEQAVCSPPDDDGPNPPPTINLCGMNSQLGLGLTMSALLWINLARRRRG